MLVWGSKGGTMDLGPQESRHCTVCERERIFRLMLQYKVSHLWYVLQWVSEKQYALVCEVCHRGEKLLTQAVEVKLGKPKIPTTSGRAWMVILASFVGLAVLGWFGGSGQAERTKELLAAPQKNDIYVVNVSPLLKSPQALGMYGLLRVRKVEGDRVEFDTPAVAYEKVTAAHKDLRNGKLADPAYFSGEPLVLSRGELAALQKNGSLDSIRRP
jgi:hypothetical protein